jgi:hypothetical protein
LAAATPLPLTAGSPEYCEYWKFGAKGSTDAWTGACCVAHGTTGASLPVIGAFCSKVTPDGFGAQQASPTAATTVARQ